MNAYTTMGQARIRQQDIDRVLRTDAYLAGECLGALERQRGWRTDAEMARLLNQHGQAPPVRGALLTVLRQTLGAALVRAGQRLAGAARRDASAQTAPVTSTLETVG